MFGCLGSKENQTILNKGTEEELACTGYQKILWRRVIYIALCVMTLGLLWLLCWWMPKLRVWMTCSRCSLKKADLVVLTDETRKVYIEEVCCDVIGSASQGRRKEYSTFKHKDLSSVGGLDESGGGDYFFNDSKKARESSIVETEKCIVRYFEHHHLRYAWNEASGSFELLCGLEKDTTCKDIMEKYPGFNPPTRINRLILHGLNQLYIDVMSYCQLLFQEVLNPFYIFQIFSIALWIWENYYIYAACIFLISLISLSVELFETRKQQMTLRNTVMTDDIMVGVFVPESQDIVEVASSMLVPGDLIHIPSHVFTMPCDAVLVSGSVVVDEGMLTGESIPVTKTHLSDDSCSEVYSPVTHKKHTLFCGTKVLQTRFYGAAKVKAIVVGTGYSTMKGELVRMILYPKPVKFSFYSDAIRFVLFLGVLALGGFVFIFTFLTINKVSWLERIPKALDVITVAVPPALPAAMTVGIIYAQARLKKSQIFCISPQRINLCGKLNCVCFDKTGTLTEDGLDLWGVVGVTDNGQGRVEFKESTMDPKSISHKDPFVVGMASCHSLTQINGEICGDPLDLKMFESVNWLLEEPGGGSLQYDALTPTIVKPITVEAYVSDDQEESKAAEVAILKQFTFESTLQRMSVIVRMTSVDHMTVFVKGSPEKIVSICVPSTVPDNFDEVLREHAAKGYRVIAMATKNLEKAKNWHHVQRMPRDFIERGLTFLGLLIMENKLKPETTPVLKHLNDAEIRTVMITGDNILTALCVARQCSIIKPGTKVIQVDAFPPENGMAARIMWHVDNEQETKEELTNHVEPETPANGALIEGHSTETILDVGEPRDQSNYQLAITGRSYSVLCQYFPELLPKVVTKGVIFARMTPDQKTSVIENIQKLGLTVGMCGDGANDCGALRTSHAGISLSQTEASVAAPFTSKVENISCVPTVIREGRASLVTSFGVFKFMAIYSIIQFVSVIILTARFAKLTDPMFLYIDLFIITTLALTMGRTGPSSTLSRRRPRARLASPLNLIGISVHILIVVSFQLAALFYAMSQTWYEFNSDKGFQLSSYDTTCIFYISIFQYLTTAFVFSKGPPFRKRIWTNVLFIVSLTVLTILSIFTVLSPWNVSSYVFQVKELPRSLFVIFLLLITLGNLVIVVVIEDVVLGSSLCQKAFSKIRCKLKRPDSYKQILKELEKTPDWPPLGQVTWSTQAIEQTRIRLPSS